MCLSWIFLLLLCFTCPPNFVFWRRRSVTFRDLDVLVLRSWKSFLPPADSATIPPFHHKQRDKLTGDPAADVSRWMAATAGTRRRQTPLHRLCWWRLRSTDECVWGSWRRHQSRKLSVTSSVHPRAEVAGQFRGFTTRCLVKISIWFKCGEK